MLGDGQLVAVRYQDKRLLKGWTHDFMPNRDYFHLRQGDEAGATRIRLGGMKAVFFLKTPGRDRACIDRRTFSQRAGGNTKVWLEFTDGEKFAGWSNAVPSSGNGFFLFPADGDSNLEKAYVFRSALERLEQGDAADAASREFDAIVRDPSAAGIAAEEPTEPVRETAVKQASEAPASEPEAGEYRMTRKELRRSHRIEKF
jgi:hypothetical protein